MVRQASDEDACRQAAVAISLATRQKFNERPLFLIFAQFSTYDILEIQVIRNALVKKWFIKIIFPR